VKEETEKTFVDEHVVARILDVAPQTLRNWRVAGKGPAFHKFGNAVRYDLEGDVYPYARRRRRTSTSEGEGGGADSPRRP